MLMTPEERIAAQERIDELTALRKRISERYTAEEIVQVYKRSYQLLELTDDDLVFDYCQCLRMVLLKKDQRLYAELNDWLDEGSHASEIAA